MLFLPTSNLRIAQLTMTHVLPNSGDIMFRNNLHLCPSPSSYLLFPHSDCLQGIAQHSSKIHDLAFGTITAVTAAKFMDLWLNGNHGMSVFPYIGFCLFLLNPCPGYFPGLCTSVESPWMVCTLLFHSAFILYCVVCIIFFLGLRPCSP